MFFCLFVCLFVLLVNWDLCTDIQFQGGSQTLYTSPCKSIVGFGVHIGGLWVFVRPQMQNKWAHMSCSVLHVYLHGQTVVDASDMGTWRTMVILITGKPKDPQFEPLFGILKNSADSGFTLVYLWISASVKTLIKVKYKVTSHPFSKLDKLCIWNLFHM